MGVLMVPYGQPSVEPNPGLVANLVCRVFFGILAILICIVPLNLLWTNGEFSAAVFVFTVCITNLITVVNSLIWRNDDTSTWFNGEGLCDIEVYIVWPLYTIYVACICSIMRHLALQVGQMRATSLTAKEKRRRNLVQSLIIFPVAILQMALQYPISDLRYYIFTLAGCGWSWDISWPQLVFFLLPNPLYALAAAVYAFLTWKRFREIEKTTRTVLSTSSNKLAINRANRAKRKLYLMAISILTPFLPLTIVFFWNNIRLQADLWSQPYDFKRIHSRTDPPYNSALLVTSADLDFDDLFQCYIPIVTAIPVFWFFGMTKSALNIYREILLKLGLGRLFPKLAVEYDPDRPLDGTWASDGHRQTMTTKKGIATQVARKGSLPAPGQSMTTTPAGGTSTLPIPSERRTHFATEPSANPPVEPNQPGPDTAQAQNYSTTKTALHSRNPFLFRTALNSHPPFALPLPSKWRKKPKAGQRDEPVLPVTEPQGPKDPPHEQAAPGQAKTRSYHQWVRRPSAGVLSTRIWSEDEPYPTQGPELLRSDSVTSETDNGVVIQTHISRSTEHVDRMA